MTTYSIERGTLGLLIQPSGATKLAVVPQTEYSENRVETETSDFLTDAQKEKVGQLRKIGYRVFSFRGSDNVIAVEGDFVTME